MADRADPGRALCPAPRATGCPHPAVGVEDRWHCSDEPGTAAQQFVDLWRASLAFRTDPAGAPEPALPLRESAVAVRTVQASATEYGLHRSLISSAAGGKSSTPWSS